MQAQPSSIHDRAVGRWRHLLPLFGIPAEMLKLNKHGPCPFCGGKDRFRFDDREGRGTWICGQCGSGNGVDAVMRLRGVSFVEARDLIEAELPGAPIVMPAKAKVRDNRFAREMWERGRALTGDDLASKYLKRRGIDLRELPREMRFAARLAYKHEDGSTTTHPALLARFVAPDAATWTVQATYLDDAGRKAKVPEQRKTAAAPMPAGGSVRLAPSAETMGVAEGVETALSAAQRNGIPVWACLSSSRLITFVPPERCKALVIFGDNDLLFGGQAAAYALAHRLKIERRDALHIEVRIPDEAGADWNDVEASEAKQAA